MIELKTINQLIEELTFLDNIQINKKDINIIGPDDFTEFISRDWGDNPKHSYIVIGFMAGIIGALLAFLMQMIPNVYSFPLLVGGLPHFSWPAFLVITFELYILFTSLYFTSALIFFIVKSKNDGPDKINDENEEQYVLSIKTSSNIQLLLNRGYQNRDNP